MTNGERRRAYSICLLYCISGCAGLIYETVWIRAFALSFGNTLLSFSTVVSVFLGGLAIGAVLGGRFQIRRPLAWYGAAELWVAGYALLVPSLMEGSTRWLAPLYGAAGEGAASVALARALLCVAILLPATVPMGAGLPWLIEAVRAEGERRPKLIWLYALNTVGGGAGAILCGFSLLPALGYRGALMCASSIDAAAGVAALLLAGRRSPGAIPAILADRRKRAAGPTLSTRALVTVAFLSGWTAMLYEVAAARIAGLLFGPTAATVTLTLAAVLVGLAAGGILASKLRSLRIGWLAGSQLAVAILLILTSYGIAVSPVWLAEHIRLASSSATKSALLQTGLIILVLVPSMTAAGIALPLTMSHAEHAAVNTARAFADLYGVNTAGCILGALLTGWILIPNIGAERTLYLGVLVNAGVAIVLVKEWSWRAAGAAVAAIGTASLIFPQWDMAAMTAGAYKYAPYYNGGIAESLHEGEMEFLQEGRVGTVTVRRVGNSQALAIDGKVDATDGGGDLLTEKLLAHLPLSLVANPRNVCVIGLASGVTAGSALTYPVEHLDVLELSRAVVDASHFFDTVNGKPLASTRTRLIVNDGRNHLALTRQHYDAILSEPSNPWISGMNAMFTRDFFRIARQRLNPGGVLAQWFHLYNMPPDDLRSLLRAFTEIFPSAALWQLNEGDVLLTGFLDDSAAASYGTRILPASALSDLAQARVSSADLLSTLYIMRGADLVRFAEGARANTDDWPVLEFHGLRDLDLQTSEANTRDLAAFPRHVQPPAEVLALDPAKSGERFLARGRMFEKAESYGLAFASYQKALTERPRDPDALAGVLRSARKNEEVAEAGTLATRTSEALSDARKGELASAEFLLRSVEEAWPERPESHLNYGLFCFERSRYEDAITHFRAALDNDPRYLPGLEAMAKTYLRTGDLPNAALWSRRILEIDPHHPAARQALEALEQRGITAAATR